MVLFMESWNGRSRDDNEGGGSVCCTLCLGFLCIPLGMVLCFTWELRSAAIYKGLGQALDVAVDGTCETPNPSQTGDLVFISCEMPGDAWEYSELGLQADDALSWSRTAHMFSWSEVEKQNEKCRMEERCTTRNGKRSCTTEKTDDCEYWTTWTYSKEWLSTVATDNWGCQTHSKQLTCACQAGAGIPTVQNVNCAGTWSPCTAACEDASQRTFTTTTAKTGTGNACPTTVDCQPGTDACPATVQNVNCAGTWSPCTAACEDASQRTFTTTTAKTGTGNACPTTVDCQPGTDACPAGTPVGRRLLMGKEQREEEEEEVMEVVEVMENRAGERQLLQSSVAARCANPTIIPNNVLTFAESDTYPAKIGFGYFIPDVEFQKIMLEIAMTYPAPTAATSSTPRQDKNTFSDITDIGQPPLGPYIISADASTVSTVSFTSPYYYTSTTADRNPKVGDVRLQVGIKTASEMGIVSLLGELNADGTFKEWSPNDSTDVLRAKRGVTTKEKLIEELTEEHAGTQTVYRFLSFFIIWGGLLLIFSPFMCPQIGTSMFSNMVEGMIGMIVGPILGCASFWIAVMLWCFVFALGWFTARPILGGIGIAISCAAFCGLAVLGNKKKQENDAQKLNTNNMGTVVSPAPVHLQQQPAPGAYPQAGAAPVQYSNQPMQPMQPGQPGQPVYNAQPVQYPPAGAPQQAAYGAPQQPVYGAPQAAPVYGAPQAAPVYGAPMANPGMPAAYAPQPAPGGAAGYPAPSPY